MAISNWLDANQRMAKAMGLENKPVVSIDISFRSGEVPTADVVFDIGTDESGEVMTELCSYKFIEVDDYEKLE